MTSTVIEVSIPTEFGNIHVYRKGSGEKAVLLLHGSGSDSAMLSWREVMDSFDEDYSVYAPDLLGYGKSGSFEGIAGEHFYDIHIESVRQLVNALNIHHFIIAGLSMGGAVAIGYALKYPEDVRCLIPVSSWGLSAKMPMHRLSYLYINKTSLTLAQYRWVARSKLLAKWSIAYSLIGRRELITEALVNEVMASCMGGRAGKSMLDFQRSSATKSGAIPYYAERLKELQMPVIYIAGEKDKLVPKADLESAAQRTPNGSLVLLKGCKHWSVKEMPSAFYEQVKALRD